MQIKFIVTKMETECFFLRIGEVVIVDYDEERVYSEDRKQYMPLDIAMKFGIDGKQV